MPPIKKVSKYLDPSYSLDERIEDLICRFTLEEKIDQLNYDSPAISRLKIPAYNWWNEALHGLARAGKATVFPQAIGLAATFDRQLVHKVASAIADEARAKYHDPDNFNKNTHYFGLTFWSPNINIFRDPRWGRGQETFGEDPYLTAEIGRSFVKGLQGDHPNYLKTAACAKHFVVHSGPEKLRHEFNAKVSLKDLHETYLPAFKALVDMGVEGIMGAYNRTNDEPCCASKTLLQDILRNDWGFNGYVVSDCWAIRDFHEHHHITNSPTESAASALKQGCDLNCGCAYDYLLDALTHGLITEKHIDNALKKLLQTRFKLGMFDPPERVPYTQIPSNIICSKKHRSLAKEAAVKSIVLLRNENKILPLKNTLERILVLGPNASNTDILLANYHGVSDQLVTILEGIVAVADQNTKIDYRKGALLKQASLNPINYAVGEAKDADVVIAVFGLHPTLEGEEGDAILSEEVGDRQDIFLPPNQLAFLKEIRETGTPMVLLLTGGSPISIPDDLADAVLFIWYPGEQGGNAVASILFGKNNPSGKLPISFPKTIQDLPAYEDYRMTHRTYRYASYDILYPFGFGLSYTTFTYSLRSISSTNITPKSSIILEIEVINQGDFDGEEVVQLYVTDVEASVTTPFYALKDFKRIKVESDSSKIVTFMITPDMLQLVDYQGKSRLEPGVFIIKIGGSSPHTRAVDLGLSEPITQTITLMKD